MVFQITAITISLIIIFAMLLLHLFSKVQDTFWWRMRMVRKSNMKSYEEKLKLNKKYSDNLSVNEKNELIKKIKSGEKTKIPIAAFDYIYRHIDEFGYVDKNGQIVLVDKIAYKNLISKTEKHEKTEND